jgi:hypothetical protein
VEVFCDHRVAELVRRLMVLVLVLVLVLLLLSTMKQS